MLGSAQRHPYIKLYLSGFFIFLILTLIPQFIHSQNELFLLINELNNPFLDRFNYYFTYLGDGITFIIIIVILLFISYGKALNGLIIFLSTALIAQLLKRFLFAERVRPFAVLSEDHQLHIPQDVSPITTLSFPSGHTVTAFALSTFIVLIYPKRNLWLPLLIAAWLTAYSRIYLTHHFPIDVWVGSLIGTLGAVALYTLLGPWSVNKFGSKSLLNR